MQIGVIILLFSNVALILDYERQYVERVLAHKGHEYLVTNENGNLEDAILFCHTFKAYPAIPDDEAEEEFFGNFTDFNFIIGIKKKGRQFVSALTGQPPPYTNFIPGTSMNSNRVNVEFQHCTQYWVAISSNTKRKIICERNSIKGQYDPFTNSKKNVLRAKNKISPNYTKDDIMHFYSKGHEYLMVASYTFGFEVTVDCTKYDAYPVEIESKEENEFIFNAIDSDYLIGIESCGYFTDCIQFMASRVKAIYENFPKGERPITFYEKNYVAISSCNGDWFEISSKESLFYICERDTPIYVKSTTPPALKPHVNKYKFVIEIFFSVFLGGLGLQSLVFMGIILTNKNRIFK